jgi:hypothetical protein
MILDDIEQMRDLLRRARVRLDGDLREEIDSVLSKPVIDWQPDTFMGGDAIEANFAGTNLSVYFVEWADETPWNWTVSFGDMSRTRAAKTKQEAIAAAEKYLRETL